MLSLQANDENKRTIKDALGTIKPENIANFTSALVSAFEILHKVTLHCMFVPFPFGLFICRGPLLSEQNTNLLQIMNSFKVPYVLIISVINVY